ncbi:hypothetical protein [Sphingorhabdus sp. 109]|jgi:hypothetical protein|uniref:hypothetical protein n=1 Tax=Sphingorhabdus sp. 109 TaxID=2653173 RepID=UPI0012F01505|nr:hypothetical protein [Sphingorhabdus sp. 109]VWX59005.1 conserved exported hypothetical protein [Sphingorhabdus sp. 109]
MNDFTVKAALAFNAVLLTALPASAMAKDDDGNTPPPAIFQDVIDCQKVTDTTARLACYDAKVSTLAAAQESRQVVVADREQIKEVRRGLFGFSLPKIRLFGGGSDEKDKEERIEQLETTITSARQFGYGKWMLTLEEGGRWQQTDTIRLNSEPRSGDSILIKTGAIGSYLASINGQRSIRVKRVE